MDGGRLVLWDPRTSGSERTRRPVAEMKIDGASEGGGSRRELEGAGHALAVSSEGCRCAVVRGGGGGRLVMVDTRMVGGPFLADCDQLETVRSRFSVASHGTLCLQVTTMEK